MLNGYSELINALTHTTHKQYEHRSDNIAGRVQSERGSGPRALIACCCA